jgi:UDP-3-O-[3-hydroxymyristoyl] glucosamine N-acyltransferase
VEKSLRELAEYLGGTLIGDGDLRVSRVNSLDDAVAGEITFLANPKYAAKVATTGASAVVLPPGGASHGRNVIEHPNPYLCFAKLLDLFHVPKQPVLGVMAGAHVGRDVVMGEEVSIYPGAVVGDGVKLGNRVTLHPNVVLYAGVTVGDDTVIHANVTVRERCRVGSRVIIQSGVVIGGDGFGYAPDGEKYYKIPQIGIVILEDDVEIGANTTIDRAALDVTRIGKGTKIDNLVQVAHNCTIGENSILVAQVGIAGSSKLGNHVTLGGQAAVAGHISIGNNVMVAGQSGVHANVADNSIVSGTPAIPHRDWLKMVMTLPRLTEIRRSVQTLERQMKELTGQAGEQEPDYFE